MKEARKAEETLQKQASVEAKRTRKAAKEAEKSKEEAVAVELEEARIAAETAVNAKRAAEETEESKYAAEVLKPAAEMTSVKEPNTPIAGSWTSKRGRKQSADGRKLKSQKLSKVTVFIDNDYADIQDSDNLLTNCPLEDELGVSVDTEEEGRPF